MRVIGIILAVVILVGIVAGVVYGVFTGYEFLSVQWGSLSNDWKAILIVLGTIMVLCSLYLSWSVQSAMKRYAFKGVGKVQVYNAFIEWYSTLKESEGEVLGVASLKILRNQMMLWGSVQVARQVKLLLEESQRDGAEREQVLKKADHVYIEIRRDLGLRGTSEDNAVV